MARPWRVLVVDDRQAEEIKEMIEGTRVLVEQDPIEVVTCKTFAEAYPALERERIDLIVLDLKDDQKDLDSTEKLAGQYVFDEIRQEIFVPVIFYSGLAHKVKDLENPFVKVLTRGGGADQIRTAIQEIFSTRIPQLLRHLEEEKRSYMWDTLLKHNHVLQGADKEEAAFLLARRLANVLESSSVRRFLSGNAPSGGIDPSGIHPVEMYVYPPVEPDLLTGDIIKREEEANAEYWIILTPSCDLVSGRAKAEQILLAKCLPLENFSTVVDYQREPVRYLKELESLIRNRSGKGRQEFRYHFLPGTSFLPGFLVDFQNLIQLPFENDGKELKNSRICSLDNPFAEALSAQFIRYYSRLGTPDLDVDKVIRTTFLPNTPDG